jgi:hypothetical protein
MGALDLANNLAMVQIYSEYRARDNVGVEAAGSLLAGKSSWIRICPRAGFMTRDTPVSRRRQPAKLVAITLRGRD